MTDQNPEIIIKSTGQGEVIVTLADARADKFDETSGIDIFLQVLINLKTKLKFKHDESVKFEPAKINRQTLMLITALKIFIEKYCERAESYQLKEIINGYLIKRKDELFYTDFAVDYETEEEYNEANAILDALGVKFYQHVIMAINIALSVFNQVLIIKADEANNSYIFNYRLMTREEQQNVENNKVNVNLKE